MNINFNYLISFYFLLFFCFVCGRSIEGGTIPEQNHEEPHSSDNSSKNDEKASDSAAPVKDLSSNQNEEDSAKAIKTEKKLLKKLDKKEKELEKKEKKKKLKKKKHKKDKDLVLRDEKKHKIGELGKSSSVKKENKHHRKARMVQDMRIKNERISGNKKLHRGSLKSSSASKDGSFVNGKFVLSPEKKKEIEEKAKAAAQTKVQQGIKDGTIKPKHSVKLDTLQATAAAAKNLTAQQDALTGQYKKAAGDVLHGHVLKGVGEAAVAPVKGLVAGAKAGVNVVKKEGQLAVTTGKEIIGNDIKTVKQAGSDIAHGKVLAAGKDIVKGGIDNVKKIATVPITVAKTAVKVVGGVAKKVGGVIGGAAKKVGGFFKGLFHKK